MTLGNRTARLPALLAITWGLVLACPTQAGTTLGRLFMTLEERAKLERMRHAPQTASVAEGPSEAAPGAAAPVRLGGYVERQDGHSSAWFNGAVVHDRMRDNGLQAADALLPEVEVRWVDGSEVTLRVGQTYDPVSNTIMEVYQLAPAAAAADAPADATAAPGVDGGAQR